MSALDRFSDADARDDDLVELFRARAETLPAPALDLADVRVRARRIARERRSCDVRAGLVALLATARERNGALVSGLSSLAAAACLLATFGAREPRASPGNDADTVAGFCAEDGAGASSRGFVSRSSREGGMSTDRGFSDATLVTCTPLEP